MRGSFKFKALAFERVAHAAGAVKLLHFLVLGLEVEVGHYPIAFQAVVLTVALELLAVKTAPGTEEVFLVVDANPFLKFLDYFGKMIGSVDVFLFDGGQRFAEGGQVGVNDGADEAIVGTLDLPKAVEPQGANFNRLLRHAVVLARPAGCFEVENDKIQTSFF